MGNSTQVDIRLSLKDIEDKIDGLKSILELMEPVVVPERLTNIPGIRLIKTGLTKNMLVSSISAIETQLKDALEEPPNEAIIKRSVLYVRGLYQPKITNELKDALRNAFDAEGKGPEAEAYFRLYKAELPAILEGEISRINLKKPKDNDWNNVSNYSPGHELLRQWTSKCGNVGVAVGFGGVLVLDEDVINAFQESGIWGIVPQETLSVETGKGVHYYYLLTEEESLSLGKKYNDHVPLYANNVHVGDLKIYRSNVIAPGSLHPSGKRYKIVNNISPVRITVDQVDKVYEILGKGADLKKEKAVSGENSRVEGDKPFIQPDWQKAIPVKDLMPEDWQYETEGCLFKGPHPVHDSSSGKNLVIYPDTNSFHCFRDNVSGGPVELVAILEGIVDCEDGSLQGWKRQHPEKYLQALACLIDRGYEIPEGEFDPRPRVVYRKDDLFFDKTAAILRGVEELYENDPLHPPLLVKDGELIRIQRVKERTPEGEILEVARPQPVSIDALRGLLNRLLKIEMEVKTKDKKVFFVESEVEAKVLKDILSLSIPSGVPLFSGLLEHPFFRPDGSLLEIEGYDRQTGLYYQPPPGFTLADRPAKPTQEDAKEAAKWVYEELLEGFRYDSEADKVNALAFILRPVLRRMVSGPMPCVFINKKQPQTGGSKHSRIPSNILTGRNPIEWPPYLDEDETRKKILATLASFPEEVMIDNVDEKRLTSHTLCSLFTSTVWSDRELGTSTNKRYEHRVCWTINGNGLTALHELMLRGFVIGLDAASAHPELRTDFKEGRVGSQFEVWVRANRGLILSKFIIIVEAWIAAGRPPATKPYGTLSEFSDAMSMLAAICDFCLPETYPGFNSMASEQGRLAEDSEDAAYSDFLRSWGMLWGDKKVIASMFGEAGVFEHFSILEIPEELTAQNMYGSGGFAGRRKIADRLRKINKKRFGEDDLYLVTEWNTHKKTWEFYMPEGGKYYVPPCVLEVIKVEQ